MTLSSLPRLFGPPLLLLSLAASVLLAEPADAPCSCPCNPDAAEILCGPSCICGCQTAPAPAPAETEPRNFGLNEDKLQGKDHPRYYRRGKEVTRQQALDAITQSDKIPDDANFLRLTVFGSDAVRKQVLADLSTSPDLAPWKGRLAVQGYDPNAPLNKWVAKDFHTATDPTIYLTHPDGKMIFRLDGYRGPQDLAGRLRRSIKPYDPAKDPDGSASPSLPLALPDWARNAPGWAWLVGGLGVLLLLSPNSPTKD